MNTGSVFVYCSEPISAKELGLVNPFRSNGRRELHCPTAFLIAGLVDPIRRIPLLSRDSSGSATINPFKHELIVAILLVLNTRFPTQVSFFPGLDDTVIPEL